MPVAAAGIDSAGTDGEVAAVFPGALSEPSEQAVGPPPDKALRPTGWGSPVAVLDHEDGVGSVQWWGRLHGLGLLSHTQSE